MSAATPEKRLWSQMTPGELLDAAQQQVEESVFGFERAKILVVVAQVRATEDLTWTWENRVLTVRSE